MARSPETPYREDLPLDSRQAPGGIVIYYADGDQEIIHVNQYVVELFDCRSTDEFLSYTAGSFRNFIWQEDLKTTESNMRGQAERQDGYEHTYYRIRTRTGRLVTVHDCGRLIDPPDGGRRTFQSFITEIRQGGSVDWLTGLPDMTRFYGLARIGASVIAQNGGRPVAVAFDIMGMKTYNARYGRGAGDQLLCSFASALRRHLGYETCSRFGEDHFYAFSEESEVESRINAVFEDFERTDLPTIPPVRAGIYSCDEDEDIVSVGLDRARIACELDRTTWLSHIMWYTDELRAQARLRTHVLDSFDTALAEGWVRPYYQAIVRCSTGDICDEEALARWIDPEYGFLSPDQFIPVLEEAGLLYKMDLHMVDCVVADLLTKRERGVACVPVSLNFSARDLKALDIADEITRRADAAGVDRRLLRVEFTESAATSDPELFREQVAKIRRAGFEIWMDDFGSGYSSLNMLKEYDFDLIKLDMGFLDGTHQEKANIIIAGVIQGAAKMGVGTLTEGVETQEQAAFLESVGCNALQGYLFAKPTSLEDILAREAAGEGRRREPLEELAYWNAIGLADLTDLSSTGVGRDLTGEPMSEFPTGILERRGGAWYYLRMNNAYREFLAGKHVLPEDVPVLCASPVGPFEDKEFVSAVDRCSASGTWERIAGRFEYGSGFQFHVAPVASSGSADAFMVSGVPTMLGAALGAYGDVPVAYAVFRVILDESKEQVIDAEYVYANPRYCDWGGYVQQEIVGRSFLEVADNASTMWFPYCYRAAILGETIHDVVYSPETGHWLSFYLSPCAVEGHCVYAFALSDDEHRENQKLAIDRDTSDLIISITDALSGEVSYDAAMTKLLETMSRIVHPDRLCIFERGERTSSNTFEWCAEGVESQKDTLQDVDNGEFATWARVMAKESVLIIPDVERLRGVDDRMHWQLSRQGITRELAVPLVSDGTLYGFLCADNYVFDESLDTKRLLTTVSSFIAAKIANRRLIDQLRVTSTRDGLTGLLNRRGIDEAIARRLEAEPDLPYALALMDIDDFKILNDVHGHDVGDEALRSLAGVVERSFPEDAIVGRNGGDEFLVMLFGEEAAQIDELAHALASKAFHCMHKGKLYRITLSVGYVSHPEQAEGLQDAYTMADAALYAIKLRGKSSAARYAPAMEDLYRSQLGFTPRDIAANMPGAIVIHLPGGDGRILYANEEAIRLFECDDFDEFMELTGGTYEGVIHPDDHARVREELGSQMSLDDIGEKDFVGFRIITKSGAVKSVGDSGRLVEVEGMGKVFYELIVEQDERETGSAYAL